MIYQVYILRCSDDSLYVGHTHDLKSRVALHNHGLGAKWTAARRPVSIVYQEEYPSEESAVKREKQIKRWSHEKKQALIDGNKEQLKRLAKRRNS